MATAWSTTWIGAPASVTCHIDTDKIDTDRSASPALPAGRFGLTVDRWKAELTGLTVIDQP